MQTMTPVRPPTVFRPGRGARRVGYGFAIGINIVLLWVVNNLLAWEFPRFLTRDFERVLPILNASIIASIVVNAALIGYDAGWFRSATNALTSGISLAVMIRLRQVFPFDFQSGGWENLTRWLLILLAVVLGIATVVEAFRALAGLLRGGSD